jgi:hypothetical protein
MASTAFRILAGVCEADMLILILDEPFLTVGYLIGWIRIPFLNSKLENLMAFFSEPIKIGII